MILDKPSSEELQNIYKELGTKPEYIKRDVESLQEWARRQPHLPSDATNATRLEKILIMCKNRMEKAKEVIDMYYTAHSEIPDIFRNRDPFSPEIEAMQKVIATWTMPKLTPDGYRVYVWHLLDKDPEKYNAMTSSKVAFMAHEIRLLEDICIGDIVIFDMDGVRLSHLKTLTPRVLQQIVFLFTKVFPARQKNLHLVNCPNYTDTIVSIIKPVLSKKLQERIVIHNELLQLQDYIPKENLPKDFGGTLPSIVELHDEWKKKIESYHDWFKERENISTDESKRSMPRKVKFDDFGGFDGSFRTLCLD